MPKFEKKLKDTGKEINDMRDKVALSVDKNIKKRKPPKTISEKDEIIKNLDNILVRLLTEVEEVIEKYQKLEKEFRTRLKKTYENAHYRRLVADYNKLVSHEGPFDYSREVISPYCDSIFL